MIIIIIIIIISAFIVESGNSGSSSIKINITLVKKLYKNRWHYKIKLQKRETGECLFGLFRKITFLSWQEIVTKFDSIKVV